MPPLLISPVLALVGERGREVGDFLKALGDEGRRRSVVVVSTSDQSPLLRIRAALAATAVAEYFSARGQNVLLVLDSLTRFAMAQREIGLAAGEPPTAKGYTPSVLAMMARLIERAGRFSTGSITGFYTVLMEGDDQQDPLVDTARSLLDGHVVLSRNLALHNHYPAISVLDSLSRLMPAISSPQQLEKAGRVRMLMAAFAKAEDLIRIGAYKPGTDAVLDKAIASLPAINAFLQQNPAEIPSPAETSATAPRAARLDMPFRFRLDAVLRFRESVERTEEAALHRIVREIAEAQLELQQLDLTTGSASRAAGNVTCAHKLPAVHLLEIAEREQELNQIADRLALQLQQLDFSESSKWPFIKARIRTARFSANYASNNNVLTDWNSGGRNKRCWMICFWRAGKTPTRHTLPTNNRQALPS